MPQQSAAQLPGADDVHPDEAGVIPTDVTRAPRMPISDADRSKADALIERYGLADRSYPVTQS